MPWREVTRMSLREEFVQLALQAGVNRRELCRRFGIAPKPGYKWLMRYARAGASGLEDRSKRPLRSPARTAAEVEQAVIRLRHESRNSWGGRKLARLLAGQGGPALAPSTVTGILRRAGLLDGAAAPGQRPLQRFERAAPNELWQMDFKGHFPLLSRSRCHPLTVLDDHSRFSLVLKACADERGETVRSVLTSAFRRYGLPAAMLMDNGAPWGSDHDHPFTAFSLWLIRLASASLMVGLITRRPRAKTSASIARSSSKFCATSTSPPSNTASASSITFASATTWFVRTMRWAWLLPPVAIAPVRSRFPSTYRRSSTLPVSRCARCKPRVGLPIADATFASARPCADSPSPCVKSISATPVVRFSSAIRWSPSSTSITLFIPTHDLNSNVLPMSSHAPLPISQVQTRRTPHLQG